MNITINKCLLIVDKFMPEFHLKQPGDTYSACGSFIIHCERIQKFREIGSLKYLYRNELGKPFLIMLQHFLIVKIYQKDFR